MITFEQFIKADITERPLIKDERIKLLAKVKQLFEAAPYNFTWIVKEGVDFSDQTLLAERKIECDNIDRQNGERTFTILYTPKDIAHTEVLVSFPMIDWPRWNYDTNSRPYTTVTDFTKTPLFNISDTEPDLARLLIRFSNGTIRESCFLAYNFYLQQTGNIAEKSIKTLEYYRSLSAIQKTKWTAHEDDALLRLKIAYLPKNQITKREHIRGSLMDNI